MKRAKEGTGNLKSETSVQGDGIRTSDFWSLLSDFCSVRCPLRLGALGVLVFGLLAASAAVWSTSGYDGFVSEKSELKNLSVSPDGIVTLAPRLTELASLDDAVVWSLAEGSGRLYAGTGHDGRVYLLEKGSKPRELFSSEGIEVLCLTTDRKGNAYFATTPGGDIYRIAPGSGPKKLCSTEADYVFALLPGPAGELYCATGQHGKLYRITATGRAQEIFSAAQSHLTSLAWLVEGKELLVGTSPDGIIYRLRLPVADPQSPIPNSSVSVLYDTPLDEIRALEVRSSRSRVENPLVLLAANPGENQDSSSPVVFCCDTAGILRWQWECPESTVLDILPFAHLHSASLLVSTGSNGRLFTLDSLGRASLLQKTEALRITSLAQGADRIWLGTASTAKVYSLDRQLASDGTLVSESYDCAGPAQFGRLFFRAEVPAGSSLSFDTRSGNSEQPDSTWSDWQPAADNLRSPRGRFIQWRARFSSTFPTATARLEQVDLSFRIPNRPPLAKKLEVPVVSPDDAREGKPSPVRNITWEVQDPDSDSLSCELQYSDASSNRWRTLAKDLSGSGRELDTRTLPDGWCRFRLIVSDRLSVPPGEAATAEIVSRPVLIDNTPPRISGLSLSSGTLAFTASDETSTIAACRYSVNSGTWQSLAPADAIFDSSAESFRVSLSLPPGENTVSVWAADACGNTTVSAVSLR